ncbi:Gfo/Idh/MocA family protein [Paracraurococcus lichenis]|uniref:Gfo/Idh/MocA family oxidoreductase n=1 Tax=Paracraurococcus lichenis TaxID=3064888 RepID=A0ABT9E1F8_9PROT|nr:Gfo/Idh/MocA family oxidoreductase [Paracraurococcus sp. LOR1-02]MDO9709940.1 Gfo/Idh/MocA family oxidoreductase [Paracraurococcus sp. LOR1-02]
MVTAGILGLGWWGRMLLEAAKGSDAIRFVHGAARRAEAGAPVCADYGIRFSTSLEALLADPAVQAVVLATPHSTHLLQIRAVAAVGKPVFCEKPLTLTRAEAVAAVEACRAAGVPLAIGHNRRFLPTIEAMRRIVAEGRLGRLMHIEGHSSNLNSSQNFAPWRHDPAESPAGGLTGTGVHVLDAFTNLVGPARRVSTQLLRHKPPPGALDSLSVMLEFASGLSGTLSAVRATPRYWRIHVFGDRASLETTSDTEVVLREDGREPERMVFAPVDTLRAELEAFAAAASGGAPYPLPPEQAVATVACFEAIVRSVAAGGAPIDVEG